MELKYCVQLWSLSLPRSSFHSFGASFPTDDKFLIIFFIFLCLPVATIIRVAIGQFDRHHGHRVVFEVFTETGGLRKFPLTPMGVLAPGSAHARPSAQPPIDMSGNFPAHVSAESPSKFSKKT